MIDSRGVPNIWFHLRISLSLLSLISAELAAGVGPRGSELAFSQSSLHTVLPLLLLWGSLCFRTLTLTLFSLIQHFSSWAVLIYSHSTNYQLFQMTPKSVSSSNLSIRLQVFISNYLDISTYMSLTR